LAENLGLIQQQIQQQEEQRTANPQAAVLKPYLASLFINSQPTKPEHNHYFSRWSRTTHTTQHLLRTDSPIPFPEPAHQVPTLAFPKIPKTTPWSIVARVNAPPQARATLHRLHVDRLPRRYHQDSPKQCRCGATETPQHLAGACPLTAHYRDQVLPKYVAVGQALVPNVLAEVAESMERAHGTGIQDMDIYELPITRPRPPNRLPFPFPPTQISPGHWLVSPALCWTAFTLPQIRDNSRIAQEFQQLWELGTSLLIYFLAIARHDEAYTDTVWSTARFTSAYNGEFTKYALAFLPPDSFLRSYLNQLKLAVPTTSQRQSDLGDHDQDHIGSQISENSPRSRRPP
ncbi:hypothetical protein DL89DRAFT_265967, partial [Linderina pennispora]